MKRQLKLVMLVLLASCGLSSCLKDEKTTVLYSTQEIPDINHFMPSTLLQLLGKDNLHFGDNPPKISGTFYADKVVTRKVSYADSTMGTHSVFVSNPQISPYFRFHDQHKGILKCEYSAPWPGSDILTFSRSDSTYAMFRNTTSPLTDSPYKPSYFNAPIDYDNFRHAYIIGKGNDFTIYYYEIIITTAETTPVNNFHTLLADIISGTLDTRTVIVQNTISHTTDTIQEQIIKNFIWGKEVIGYFSNDQQLPNLIQQGLCPMPGDTWYNDNCGRDVYQKPFEGDF